MESSTGSTASRTDFPPAGTPVIHPPDLHASTRTLVMGIPVVLLASALDMIVPLAGIPVAVISIWIFLKRTGHGWADLGLGRPRSWGLTLAMGVGLAVVLSLASYFVIEPLLQKMGSGAPDLSRFESLRGNIGMLAVYLTVSWTTAGFGEEIIWRGFLMSGLARLLGGTRSAWAAGLLLMTVLFGLLHWYQGPAGIVSTGLIGFAFGCIYLASGRNLWIVIIAHGLMDTFSFLLLFAGVEI